MRLNAGHTLFYLASDKGNGLELGRMHMLGKHVSMQAQVECIASYRCISGQCLCDLELF